MNLLAFKIGKWQSFEPPSVPLLESAQILSSMQKGAVRKKDLRFPVPRPAVCPGEHQNERGQRGKEGGPFGPVLCPRGAAAVLCAALGSPVRKESDHLKGIQLRDTKVTEGLEHRPARKAERPGEG